MLVLVFCGFTSYMNSFVPFTPPPPLQMLALLCKTQAWLLGTEKLLTTQAERRGEKTVTEIWNTYEKYKSSSVSRLERCCPITRGYGVCVKWGEEIHSPLLLFVCPQEEG